MKKTEQLRKFWYNITTNQRDVLRQIYYSPIDLFDKVTGRRIKYVPPRGVIYTGSPASAKKYMQQGFCQLELLKEEINLLPDDTILDIGSGVGRTAIALTTYLNENGNYDGFDVVKKGVDWCESGIGKDFPNFNFKFIPLFNDLYNTSKLKTLDFTFPYKAKSFDKIFSFSVFTHMQIDEIQHYFNEIESALKVDGLCFSTFFLYDSENEDYIAKRKDFNFPFKHGGFRLMNESVKSGNIAINKTKLNKMLKKARLKKVKLIDGYWKDKIKDETKKEYQDIVVFKKA